ncbi:hypothetical protein GCM10022393_15450 [Aquimarina addita]|uniref:Uncharacterized protein n=1 Tax=Aquimarina addita TaxID=870485 RepID=A0ABP7XFY4_9FLAO
MGLAEKRVLKSYQETTYQELVKKINKTASKNLEFEVQWESLTLDGKSHLYDDCWTKVYFEPVLAALESICADEMGKEAVQEGLEKIIIKNEQGISSPNKWCTMSDKTIILDHKPITNIGQTESRAKTLQKLLEDSL